jgi:hypothetical protein
MLSNSQILNTFGIILEIIGIGYAIIKFPTPEKHDQEIANEHIARSYGGTTIKPYSERRRDLICSVVIVGCGLLLELIAVFIQ